MSRSSPVGWRFELRADARGRLIARPNRFLALVDLGDGAVEVHVHDPGRLPQVLTPGGEVLLRRARNPRRRTAWDLLAGRAEGGWVLAHSGWHRPLVETLLRERGGDIFPGLEGVRPEPQVGEGRLDYLLTVSGTPLYVETKGVTLAEGERALFPDAPTQRGRRHLRALASLRRSGARALVWFLVFRPETTCFAPAEEVDPDFARALAEALAAGVELRATRFAYDGRFVTLLGDVPLCPGGR